MDDIRTRQAELAAKMFTRRQYLEYRAAMAGASIFAAREAVSSVAIEHPEWDMDEEMTWAQWDAQQAK